MIHIPSALRADVYIAGEDPLHAWGLERRRQLVIGGATVSIAPPEYVILRKLQYSAAGGGDRHLRDIRRMLDRALVPMDVATLEQFVTDLGLGPTWQRARSWREPG